MIGGNRPARPLRRYAADLQLVERMLGGDEDAFTAFGERYLRACYRFTLGLLDGDRDLTRDTVQTAITKALSRLDNYRGEAALGTWLCACCRNEVRMHRRRQRSRPSEVPLEAPDPGGGEARSAGSAAERELQPAAGYRPQAPPGPESALIGRESALRVHAALDVLPRRYADALEWKYVDGLPVAEIAARLRLTPKAAESMLGRARAAFRRRYREGDPDAAETTEGEAHHG
jgi:RNA polymerase sigma-70 factor (ECF subfamily)